MTKSSKLFKVVKMKLKVLGSRRFIFLLLSLIALTEDVHTRMMTKKCTSDEECGEDYACSEGVCHSCFNCALLFREGPCVIDFKQCGCCLKGYKDFPITDFSTVIKPCEKIESKAYSQECLNDQQCPFDYYCHEKFCVKCFDCSLYNRLPPTENCAKEPQDCSSCVNGFYEVPVTTEANSKPCQKLTSHSIENVLFLTSSYSIAWIFLVVLEIITVVVFLIYKTQTGKRKQVVEVQSHSPRPPPYQSEVCQYVREPDLEVEEESSFFTYVQEEKEHQNTAKIFKLPQASYYYGSQDDIDRLFANYLEDEEEDVNSSAVDPSDVPLLNNTTETDFLATCAQDEDDFEVISESEMNMETESDGHIVDSNPPVEERSPTVEESKNGNEEGKGVEQREKSNLTE